ncbi:MAG: hypothetical protein C0522_11505 [Rhodocyclaceae bacterium]|nr:hypothetical protein [Rhodocyclaceae bacterium]
MNQTYQPLHPTAPLRFDDAACRTLRGPYGSCRACAAVCPAGVLAVDVDEVRLKDGCLGCGRCVSACPTEALRVEGFDASWDAPADAVEPLRVDCWKAPARAVTGELRVPCLGGLSAGRLLELWNAAGSRGLFLMDRGWCRHCSAGGGGQHAAMRALGKAQEWLIAVGVARDRLPRLVREPLPASRMPAAIPDAALQRKVSRRNFFRAAVAQAADVAQAAKPPRSAFAGYRSGASAERARLLEGVAVAARQAGRPLPVALFPAAILDDVCAGHGVCARVCPTGALSSKDAADGGRALVFDAAACIGCGCCARACPERALRIEAAKTLPAGLVELRRWVSRECEHCGDTFADGSDAALCPLCRKNRGLARDAFGALYGAPA